MSYFPALQNLLKTEREVDKQAYLELSKNSSAAERRASGITWYPIAIKGTELNKAEYITVEVERVTHTDIPHSFRFGVSVRLFSNHDPKQDFLEGTVNFAGGSRMKISFRTDELPEWADAGKLGIDLLFDDNSYEEMTSALRQAMELEKHPKDGRLIRILNGKENPSLRREIYPYELPKLNPSQQKAVHNILQGSELSIVHGPPGTGKTTTLVQAIKALIKSGEKKILVCAPSNTAVDLLSEKLAEEGLNVLRVGNPARVSEKLMRLTLDSKIQAHSSMKEIKMLKKRASEFKDMAHKYKRTFGKSEREQRKALFDEAYKIMKEVGLVEQHIMDDITDKAQVITATLVGTNHYTVRNLRYETVVIDEAGQALEPACWIPILKAQKVVLAGDHCQLPPTIKSEAAAKGGLALTLFEKNIQLHPESVIMLEEQYRMHETIMGFSSEVFYQNRLKAHVSVAQRTLFSEDTPLSFIDTAGCGFEEITEQFNISNPEEAALLFKNLYRLIQALSTQYIAAEFPDIGIISPYKEQLSVLKNQFQQIAEFQPYADKISINTIDSFQGQERDIIYICMTRSNTEGSIGFLSDTRRMNVALTRARKKLVVIGDSATLSVHPFYDRFIRYAQEHAAYKSAWEENWEN